jgi:dUTP pyrophosphatase
MDPQAPTSPHWVQVPIQKLRPQAVIPSYATEWSSGLDLHSCILRHIQPYERLLIPTGLAFAIPEGFEGQIRPRSGLAFQKGITVINSPGTLDADYREEVMVALINLSSQEFLITEGMRVAQLVIAPVIRTQWKIQDELSTTHRTGGFGSTGL